MQNKIQFIVKKISQARESELENIGFDSTYVKQGLKKHNFLSLKVFNLKPQQASILKQCALSLGTDCAVHRHVLDCKIEKSNAILSGTVSQLGKMSQKLLNQPFSLSHLGKEIDLQIKILTQKPAKPKIMGILNLTLDSFSDGGECLSVEDALLKARKMIEEGADILDIGAESTNPNSKPIDQDKEIVLLTPVIKALKKEFPNISLSIDTRNSKTAEVILDLGADIINDVSGFSWDEGILEIAKKAGGMGKKYVLMHSRGTPENMDTLCNYENIVDEVYFELHQKLQKLLDVGVELQNIIIDPGFGFAKNQEQNLVLLKHIEEFKSLGAQVLVGTSRKRFLAPFSLSGSDNLPKERDAATALTSFYAALKGIDYVRVHNAQLTKNAVDLAATLV